jgi:hypothetical protein
LSLLFHLRSTHCQAGSSSRTGRSSSHHLSHSPIARSRGKAQSNMELVLPPPISPSRRLVMVQGAQAQSTYRERDATVAAVLAASTGRLTAADAEKVGQFTTAAARVLGVDVSHTSRRYSLRGMHKSNSTGGLLQRAQKQQRQQGQQQQQSSLGSSSRALPLLNLPVYSQ